MKKFLAALMFVLSTSAAADFVAQMGDITITFFESVECIGKAAQLVAPDKGFKGGSFKNGDVVLNLCWVEVDPNYFFIVDDDGDFGAAPKELFKEVNAI